MSRHAQKPRLSVSVKFHFTNVASFHSDGRSFHMPPNNLINDTTK